MLRIIFLIIFFTDYSHAAETCPNPKVLNFEKKQTIIRKPKSALGFTQGLEFYQGKLYESTGGPQKKFHGVEDTTKLNIIDKDGKVSTLIDHGHTVFGEGLTIMNSQIYQLTWNHGLTYHYDLEGNLSGSYPFPRKEGWGLTNNGRELISSDGSNVLTFHKPNMELVRNSAGESKKIKVRDNQFPISKINELEYVKGATTTADRIFANHGETNAILSINPETGCVEAKADLNSLINDLPKEYRDHIKSNRQHILNGIAYDKESGSFYITGKMWPFIWKGTFTETKTNFGIIKPKNVTEDCNSKTDSCVKKKNVKR